MKWERVAEEVELQTNAEECEISERDDQKTMKEDRGLLREEKIEEGKRKIYEKAQRQCNWYFKIALGTVCVFLLVLFIAFASRSNSQNRKERHRGFQKKSGYPSNGTDLDESFLENLSSVSFRTSGLETHQTVMPGENLVWFGPFRMNKPGIVRAILPVANLSFVHHLVIYKSSAKDSLKDIPNYQNDNRLPWPLEIIFAWARTGQQKPQPFSTGTDTGLFVGPGTDAELIYLNIHYEVPVAIAEDAKKKEAVIDVGLTIWFEELQKTEISSWQECSKTPDLENSECKKGLGVELLAESSFSLPPKREFVDIDHTCRLNRDIVVYAYRNHAHTAGRQFYTHLFRENVDTGRIIDRSVQEAQIFYKISEGGIHLRKNDVLQLHCTYETSDRSYTTIVGADLSKGEEMCNQYLMYYPLIPFSTSSVCNTISRHIGISKKKYELLHFPLPQEETARLPPPQSLGEVSGIAVSNDGSSVFILARRGNDYFSDTTIPRETIFQLDPSSGAVVRAFGANLFKAPHGLYCDHDGNLWVTDVALHQVMKLNGKNGEVMLTIGEASVEGDDETHFNGPTDVVVDKVTGLAYISDGYGNSRVVVVDSASGKFESSWGSFGTEEGEFKAVHNIAFDTLRRRVLVADRENSRIQIFSPTGKLLHVWNSNICRPAGIPGEVRWAHHLSAVAYSAYMDLLYTVEGDRVVIRRPDSGTVVETFGKPGEFQWPHDIDVALEAKVPAFYVGILNSKNVTRFMVPPKPSLRSLIQQAFDVYPRGE